MNAPYEIWYLIVSFPDLCTLTLLAVWLAGKICLNVLLATLAERSNVNPYSYC